MSPSSALSALKAQRLYDDSDTGRSFDEATPTISEDGGESAFPESPEDREEVVVQLSNYSSNDHTPQRGPDHIVYGLKNKNVLTLRGQCRLRVRKGTVKVSGVTLGAGDTVYDLYSPASSSLIVIECTEKLPRGAKIEALDSYPSIVELGTHSSGLENVHKLIPRFKGLWKADENSLSFEVVREGPETTPRINIFDSWQDLGEKILLNVSQPVKPSVVVVGPKSSGKSTFAKFLVNMLVANSSTPFYLDLDPGQAEFCPPGTLSLHRPSKTYFGPPFTHADFVDCARAASLGYLSPRERPLLYLSQAGSLMREYERLTMTEHAPLVVNTPGWTKGLGAELIAEIINLTKPQLVVHMGDAESASELGQMLTHPVEIVALESAREQFPPNLHYSAADMRTLQTMSYLHANNFKSHLTELPPFAVPYDSSVSAGIAAAGILDSEGIDLDDVPMALNGTLVAIVAVSESSTLHTTSAADEIPYLVPESLDSVLREPDTHCLGYAVVQSIDASSKAFRLVTPTPASRIAAAYEAQERLILVRGRLQLPLWAFWDHRNPSNLAKTPYLSKASAGAGAEVRRVRRNVQRRG